MPAWLLVNPNGSSVISRPIRGIWQCRVGMLSPGNLWTLVESGNSFGTSGLDFVLVLDADSRFLHLSEPVLNLALLVRLATT